MQIKINFQKTIKRIARGVFILYAICFIGCKTVKNIGKPIEEYTSNVYKPVFSSIAIPVSIQQQTLLDKINRQVDGLLYADTSFEGDNLMLKVWKAQAISLGASGNIISYRIPLRIWVNTGVSKWGITIQKDLQMELALKYHTTFCIQPDWNIESSTLSDGYEWLSAPYITIAGLQIPVRSIANRIIDGLQNKVAPEIDKQIKQNINIRKYANELWTNLQKPILINSDYHLWLKLQPNQVFMTPFVTTNGNITATLGMQAISEIFFSKQIPESYGDKPLPPFKMPAKAENELKINMGIDIPFIEAEELANKELIGKVFNSGKKQVTIKGLNIYGSSDKAVIAADLSGSYNGKIYLKGIPYYNTEQKCIALRDVDFSLETKNILFKSAGWLFHSGIAEKIAQESKFPVGAYFESAKLTANQNLKNVILMKNIILKGEVTRIDVGEINLTPHSFRVQGLAEGKMEAVLQGLDF